MQLADAADPDAELFRTTLDHLCKQLFSIDLNDLQRLLDKARINRYCYAHPLQFSSDFTFIISINLTMI